jgi:RNA polymerase sigma-70 factor (ECF subfamily)
MAANPANPSVSPSGSDLVSRIQAGDSAAEEELVHRYSRGVSVILSTIVAQVCDMEDLRQETLRVALTKIRQGDVREPEKLSGFISSLARNLAIQHFRHSSRREVTGTIEAESPLADPSPSPFQQVLRQENASIIRQVLSEVRPVRYREILYRYYVAEEEKDRICARLGLSSLHFNRVLQRARDRYRELYLKAARRS